MDTLPLFLLAIGATSAHMQQLVFGYRYLVVSLLALMAFARWLRVRDPRWIFAAGLLTGLSLVFRLTPAFVRVLKPALGIDMESVPMTTQPPSVLSAAM